MSNMPKMHATTSNTIKTCWNWRAKCKCYYSFPAAHCLETRRPCVQHSHFLFASPVATIVLSPTIPPQLGLPPLYFIPFHSTQLRRILVHTLAG